MTFPMTLGARYLGEGKTEFRVWAPDRRGVDVCFEGPEGLSFAPLRPEEGGSFTATLRAEPGRRYRYRLDGGDRYPDPCSRFQPEGPHGPSEVVDPSAFRWRDEGWRGLEAKGQVFYELHVGAFTPQGTYAAVIDKLPELKELGVTCLELMPLATWPGRFNWGYDGVNLFAPCPAYGRPDDLRRLIDRAHAVGLGVIIDVVYNHLGPDGNFLKQFARRYFTDKYPPEWGEPINFEDDAAGVRRFFVENAVHWVTEYHADGLRLDATQNLFDPSPRHIVGELTDAVRAAAGARKVLVIGESEPQDIRLIRRKEDGGDGADGLWADDFHHAARVAVTGGSEAYLRDYTGSAEELIACALYNSLYQGQWYQWQKKPRGSPLLHSPAEQIVFFLQNHDQIANTLRGHRLHVLAGPRRTRALTTLFLLLPQTPLLFMGQEFFASSPFLFFVDHHPELMKAVRAGRERYLSQFPTARHAIEREGYHPPIGDDAFALSKLDWSERSRNAATWDFHRALLALRREDAVFARQDKRRIHGCALSEAALALRFLGDGQEGDRLLVLNLGRRRTLESCPIPLIAPPEGRSWRPVLSSEDTKFGGCGGDFPTWDGPLAIPAESAMVLTSAG